MERKGSTAGRIKKDMYHAVERFPTLDGKHSPDSLPTIERLPLKGREVQTELSHRGLGRPVRLDYRRWQTAPSIELPRGRRSNPYLVPMTGEFTGSAL
jgi:hypothetical protein